MNQNKSSTQIGSHYPRPLLALTPGTRYLGFAIFVGSRLYDWGVKVIGPGTPDEKSEHLAALLAAVIGEHQPEFLFMKKPDPRRSSKLLDRLVVEMTQLAESRGVQAHSLNLRAIKRLLLGDENATKRELVEYVVAEYPFLGAELETELTHGLYRGRMFDAVALGMAARRCLGRI